MSMLSRMVWGVFAVAMMAGVALAQTSSMSYQGMLNDGALGAEGDFDFRFSLYSAETGGTALGTDEHLGVAVVGGVFDVMLDFGETAFESGSDRYLGIEVRESGGGSYVALDPRVMIGTVPFAEHADRAEVAQFASSGPFEPRDTTPESTSGAAGMNVSVSAEFDGLMTSGWEVDFPIRIARDVIYSLNGDALYGGTADFEVELTRDWDETSFYADLFVQGIIPVEVSIAVTRAGDRTDYVFSSGAISGHRLANDPNSNGLVEVLTVVFQQPATMDPLSSYASRVSTGFLGAGTQTGIPFGGGDAPRDGLYFYEFDGYVDPYSNVGELPTESRFVNQRFPTGDLEAEPVSVLMNVFSDRFNMFWGPMTASSSLPGRLYLVDDRGTRLWEAEPGNANRAIVGSWTLDRADDGGVFETYEIYYNPAMGF